MQHKKLAYTADEAAEILGFVSRHTIYRMVRNGDLRWTLIGRKKKITARTLDEYVAKQEAK